MRCHKYLFSILLVVSFSIPSSRASAYSTDDLLRLGREAWGNNQCVKAAEFLFAYTLRNPPAFQSNAEHRKNVMQAISWCEANARLTAGSKTDDANDTGRAAPRAPSLELNAGGSPADRRCAIYATLAVAQNDANAGNGCGFTGGRWSSDFSYHYNWCTVVASDQTRVETQTRNDMLQSCAP